MGMTRGQWARDFLNAIGNSNPDARTVNFVAAWTLGENTRARYNPLATTQPHAGETCFSRHEDGSCWVRNYLTHQDGIEATATTIKNGRYPHLLHGLQTNDPEEAVNAIELGVWGTGLGFTTLWRLGDHTGGQLLSHVSNGGVSGGQGGGGGTSGFGDEKPEPGILDYLDPTNPVYDKDFEAQNEAMQPDVIARNLSFIALGGLLLAIAIVLAIRTFVPTQQIVKTIATVV